MASTLRMSENFTVEIGAAVASVASGSTLDSQHSGTDVTDNIKEVSISGGERDLETMKLLGYNESRDLKRATILTCTFTTVAGQGNAAAAVDWESWMMGVAQAVTGAYYRNIGGEKSSNDRTGYGVLIKWTDGTNNIVILLNNAYATTTEWGLTADGSWEQTVTFKCLASEFYYEDDFA